MATETPALSTERIFYDGECGVCHWAVGFVARHDRTAGAFRFAPLGGETFDDVVGAERRSRLPDSMVVLTADGDLLLRSQGLIHILSRLGPLWRALGMLLRAVPRPLRDWAYDAFAAARYRLAARPEGTCPLMPPELGRRFDP